MVALSTSPVFVSPLQSLKVQFYALVIGESNGDIVHWKTLRIDMKRSEIYLYMTMFYTPTDGILYGVNSDSLTIKIINGNEKNA